MNSTEYNELVEAIKELYSSLINFPPRSDGDYSKEELLKCQAFTVFSHAEIENYLERTAEKILKKAEREWINCEKKNKIMLNLFASRILKRDKSKINFEMEKKLTELVSQAFDKQLTEIKQNNGIKVGNLSKLFAPLGIVGSDLPSTLVVKLNGCGSRRGDIVHQRQRISLLKLQDPFEDAKDINSLVTELVEFDCMLVHSGFLD
jgi:hypothetical protein